MHPTRRMGVPRMTKQIIPNDARVLVKPLEAITERASGIVIPDNAKGKPTRGEVLAIGPGTWASATGNVDGPMLQRIPLDIRVGDVVIYPKFAGDEYRDPETQRVFLFLRAHEVLGIERDVAAPGVN